jgi:sporulation protein YlmC with PRC-barrel domain
MTHHATRPFVACAGVLMLLAGAARGQPQNPVDKSPVRPGETYRPVRDARPVILVPAKSIVGSAVRGRGDEKIGEMKDLVISRTRGRIAFALVGHGGVMSIGEKVTAVPFSAFDYDRDKQSFALPLTADRLASAPTLDPKEWETLADPSRTEAIYSHFDAIRPRSAEQDEPDARPGNTPRLPAAEHPVLRASDLEGKPLMSNDGREIGKVDGLVMDASSGRIALVIVTFGGVLGIGSEHVPVPWPVFDVNKDGHLYAVNIDKEQLSSAPRLKDKDWNELRQPDFAANVYRHFGRTAAWLDKGAPASIGAAEGSGATAAYDGLCTRGLPHTIDGTITAVDETSPMDGVPKIVILTVDNGPGDPARVHLAPRSYLDQNGISPKIGQKVSLRGRDAEIDGKRCIIATEYTTPAGATVALRLGDGTSTWRWK